ncbi:hypothetical protein H4R34_002887 [Dimargaris verticillata]|uniref:Pentatricopeptide repeat-containing protein-mitochondrial domain-containing protein n=1 Tax=Dimargaris verticillata TaxID=2761393 RepID=A0A9W8B5M7_9FUNG|nr:hypothetical protein H4R34_002887 [Dimargaris verticillata]
MAIALSFRLVTSRLRFAQQLLRQPITCTCLLPPHFSTLTPKLSARRVPATEVDISSGSTDAPAKRTRQIRGPRRPQTTQLRALQLAHLVQVSSSVRRRYLQWLMIEDSRFKATYRDVWEPLTQASLNTLTASTAGPHHHDDHRQVLIAYRVRQLCRLLKAEPDIDKIWHYYMTRIATLPRPGTRSPSQCLSERPVLVTHASHQQNLLTPRLYEWFVRVLNVEMLDPNRSSRIVTLVDHMHQLFPANTFVSTYLLANYVRALFQGGRHRQSLKHAGHQIVTTVEAQLALTLDARGFPLSTKIMNHYMRALMVLGRIQDAHAVFNDMIDHPDYPIDEYSFTFMIRELCQLGLVEPARAMYSQLLVQFPAFSDISGFNAILHSFALAHAFDTVQTVLSDMAHRAVGLDNATLSIVLKLAMDKFSANHQYTLYKQVYHLYQLRQQQKALEWDGFVSSIQSFVAQCTWPAKLPIDPVDYVLLESFVSSFVSMRAYALAGKVLDAMAERGLGPSPSLYESLIDQLIQLGHVDQAIAVYRLMAAQSAHFPDDFKPNMTRAEALVLTAYFRLDPAHAHAFLDHLQRQGHPRSNALYNALLYKYVDTGDMRAALRVYQSLPQHGLKPDLSTYLGLFRGFMQLGDPTLDVTIVPTDSDGKAAQPVESPQFPVLSLREVYKTMRQGPHLVATAVLFRYVLASFIRIGDLAGLSRAYQDMVDHYQLPPTADTYEAMIRTFARRSDLSSALTLFDQMRQHTSEAGPSLPVGNALLNGLFRAHACDQALAVFAWMTDGQPLAIRLALDVFSEAAQPPYATELDDSKYETIALDPVAPLCPDRYTMDVMIRGLLVHNRAADAQRHLEAMMTTWGTTPWPALVNRFVEHYMKRGQVTQATAMLEFQVRLTKEMQSGEIHPTQALYLARETWRLVALQLPTTDYGGNGSSSSDMTNPA